MDDRLNAPLYNAVVRASVAEARFCMPSHSGAGREKIFASAPFDYTEVEGLDNLACPSGVILEAEELAAEAQGCARTLFVTQGSTVCMHMALSLAKERGKVGFIGDMHKSFFGGCTLLDIQPVCYRSIEEFLAKSPKTRNVSSVFYTSPDYFGNVADDGELIKLCAKEGILTVADAAHGAHFAFSRLLPEAAAGRADISFCSTHKTMDVYTGGAFFNLKDGRLYEKAVYYRQLWHTTSPSYLVMATTDLARAVYSRDGEEIYTEIFAEREKFARALDPRRYSIEKSDDLSRLVIGCGDRDAAEICSYLAKKGIYAEAAIGNMLIFILNRSNYKRLPFLAKELNGCGTVGKCVSYSIPDRKKSRSGGTVAFIPVEEGEGKICANEIGFYPPGTPFVRRGEIFTAEDVRLIAENAGCTFGLVNGKLVVLQ